VPCDYSKYPKNWMTVIRPSVLNRAGDRCEFCDVPNGAVVVRDDDAGTWQTVEGSAVNAARADGEEPVKIILTVAHLNHNVNDNRPENLKALCQRCHLRWDAELHRKNAAKTRDRKRLERGEVFLPGLIEQTKGC